MGEFIYILENPSMPNVVKIGRPDRNVSERIMELSSHTGVPTNFVLVKEFPVADSIEAESKIHQRLAEYRISENREFFKIPVEDAIAVIESMVENTGELSFSRDFERREALIAQAIDISIQYGTVYPGLFVGLLKVSYEEAELLIRSLKESGHLNEKNERNQFLHQAWLRAEAKRKKSVEIKDRIRVERHYLQIEQVKELLSDLQDPETGEFPEISFDREDEDLVVEVKGTDWLKTEAQKRLASLA